MQRLSIRLSNTPNLVAISCLKYDLSLFTYIRFLAKSNGFKTKRVSRKFKFNYLNYKWKSLVSGPVLLFYSFEYCSTLLLEKLKVLKGILVLFVSFNNVLLLETMFDKEISLNNELTSINSVINSSYLNLNINSVKYNLFYLLDAYSKSISKKS